MAAPTEEQMLKGFRKTTESVEVTKEKPNEKPEDSAKPNGGAQQLRSLVDRIVRLEEEKAGLAADIKEIYEESKSAGWAKKAVRIVVKRARWKIWKRVRHVRLLRWKPN